MKWYFSIVSALIFLASCASNDKYDVLSYHSLSERDSVLASIVNYIFIAPPYTLMKDRFKPEHRRFYTAASAKFSIDKYYVAPDGTHFFYVVRPAPKTTEKRGVGGYFKLDDHFKLSGFREVFVTQIMPENDVKVKCAFLFDEMVKGNIEKYLDMRDYIQWPNKISQYDTTSYEWTMEAGQLN